MVNCHVNRPDAAVAAVQRAMRLSPLDPMSYFFRWVRAYALVLAGRYEEAMDWVDRTFQDQPGSHVRTRAKVALCWASSPSHWSGPVRVQPV